MSIVKKIYFSPLGFLISVVMYVIGMIKKPLMMYGYYDNRIKKILKGVRISSSAIITKKSNLKLGDNVWVNHYARIDASGGVTIGEGCQIGYSSMILSHSSHNAIRLNGENYIHMDINERVGYIHKPVVVGDYTFIGGGACIMPGVTIGKGCVVGVNSVVTKDIPDYSIVVGIPARIIGSTQDTDKVFIHELIVRKNYYDSILLEDMIRNCE